MQRCWSQAGDPIAPIPGPGGIPGGVPGAWLSLSKVTFDKNPAGADHKDATVRLSPADYTLQSITNGNYTLVKDKDYTVDGGSITFLTSYLDTLAAGSYEFIFNMSGGENPALNVAVVDTAGSTGDDFFRDVNSGDWFYDDVAYMYEKGLMNGTSTNPLLFSPNMAVTRGMVVTLLWRVDGSPAASGSSPFGDVQNPAAYYYDAVVWAAQNEIVNGYPNGNYGPEDPITREQLAAIFYRYQQFSGQIPPNVRAAIDFADWNSVSEWAKESVTALTMQGLINGEPGNRYNPKGNATRAQLAAVTRRFLEAV